VENACGVESWGIKKGGRTKEKSNRTAILEHRTERYLLFKGCSGPDGGEYDQKVSPKFPATLYQDKEKDSEEKGS